MVFGNDFSRRLIRLVERDEKTNNQSPSDASKTKVAAVSSCFLQSMDKKEREQQTTVNKN